MEVLGLGFVGRFLGWVSCFVGFGVVLVFKGSVPCFGGFWGGGVIICK